ncbi:hypothetical protein Tco_0697355 [Tanacetum coccineum]
MVGWAHHVGGLSKGRQGSHRWEVFWVRMSKSGRGREGYGRGCGWEPGWVGDWTGGRGGTGVGTSGGLGSGMEWGGHSSAGQGVALDAVARPSRWGAVGLGKAAVDGGGVASSVGGGDLPNALTDVLEAGGC